MRIAFFGTDDYSLEHLKAVLEAGHDVVLVVSQPDRPKGRGRKIVPTPVKVLALEKGLRLVQPSKLGSEDFIEILEGSRPDVAVVASFGKIIPGRVLEIPRFGFYNVHPSLLPKYRGASPIRRALERGEKETGVTIFKVVEKLDSGPIALQKKLGIGEYETYGELRKRLIDLGRDLLKEFLDVLDSGEVVLRPQNDEEASYAPKVSREDLALDFSRPCVEVKDKIRAYDPSPGVIARLGGVKVKLFGVKGLEEGLCEIPGKLISIEEDGAWIGCGDGKILVGYIQFPGKRVMRFWDAKNGRKISTGDVLERVEF